MSQSRLKKDSGYHYLFLDKNISPIEIDQQENENYIATYKIQGVEGQKSDERYSVYSTRKGIFHTGSQGTIVFNVNNANEIGISVFDYRKEELGGGVESSKKVQLNSIPLSQNIDKLLSSAKTLTALSPSIPSELSLLKDHKYLQGLSLKKLEKQAMIQMDDRGSLSVSNNEGLYKVDDIPFLRVNKDQIDIKTDNTKAALVRRLCGI